jgi:ribosomal protein S18 acetylase RimI-like enzyme
MVDLARVSSGEDIARVARLAHTIWNEYFPAIIGQAQVDYMVAKFQSAPAIQTQLAQGYSYYLLQADGREVGYISVVPRQGTACLQISKFYILKDHRGRGIGRQVLTRVMHLAREQGYTTLWLTVNKYNLSTIAAYEKLGFSKSGELVTDIGQGYVMDDYTMEMAVAGRPGA